MKLPDSTKVHIDKRLLKDTRAGMKGKVEYNVMWAPKEKQSRAHGEKQKVLFLVPGVTGESEGGTM